MHAARKLWHLSSGLIVILVYHYLALPQKTWAMIALSIGLLATTFDLLRMKVPVIKKHATKFLAPILREEEYNSFTGVPFYALGCFITLYFNPDPWAIISIYFLVFVDPIASYFGIRFGKKKILGDKTWVGFTAGSIIGILVCGFTCEVLFDQSFHFTFYLLAGLSVGLIESLSWKIEDNFSIPAFSGFALSLLARLFGQ